MIRSLAVNIGGYIQKYPNWVDNKIYAYNNKHSLRSNTKGSGGKTHYTDSQNSDTTAPIGRELYHLQFSLQEASSKTSGYTLVFNKQSRTADKGWYLSLRVEREANNSSPQRPVSYEMLLHSASELDG
jgi:hypothetical protein